MLISSRASADEGPTVAVDRIEITGTEGGDAQEILSKAVRDVFTFSGANVVAADGEGAGCAESMCMVDYAKKLNARFILRANVAVVERDYNYGVELYDGETGERVGESSGSCPICGLSEAQEALQNAAREVAAVIPRAATPSELRVTSTPPGALVFIDGALRGLTPVDLPVEPGSREITVRKDGFFDATKTATLESGVDSETVTVTLVKRPASPGPLVPLGWAAIGLGGAAVASGVVLMALNHRPFKARCEGEDMDALGRCRFRYDTMGGGVASLGVGLAAVGTGIALLLLDRRRKKSTTQPTLRAGVSPRGVVFSGRF